MGLAESHAPACTPFQCAARAARCSQTTPDGRPVAFDMHFLDGPQNCDVD